MTWYHSPDHPVWTVARLVAAAVTALVLHYVNASSFDTGELVSALGTVLVTFGVTRR